MPLMVVIRGHICGSHIGLVHKRHGILIMTYLLVNSVVYFIALSFSEFCFLLSGTVHMVVSVVFVGRIN